jgi:hypothetical protein
MIDSRLLAPFVLALSVATVAGQQGPVRSAGQPPSRPDLEGTWNASTLTPLQRPSEFRDRATFTREEAAEWVRTAPDRVRARLPSDDDRLTQADLDDTYVEIEAMQLAGLRTSLVIDPANGVLPPLLPAAQARIAARPKRSFDDPEALSLFPSGACSGTSVLAVRPRRRHWSRVRSSLRITRLPRRIEPS